MNVSTPSVSSIRGQRSLCIAFTLTLALFVLGARWGYVDRFGTDLPWWDQWDAEGRYLLAPWYEQGSFFSGLFRAHNEHRVVLTKLVNFSLTLANGCWDQRLQIVINALLPASIAAALLWWSQRFCPRRVRPLVWLLLAVAWGLPLAWPNVLSAFHSQQFFLIGLSFCAIAWLPAPPGTRRWWFGAVCAVLALGSMASGFFAVIVASALVGWRLIRRETDWRSARPTLMVAAAVILIAVGTRATVEYHEGLKAHNWCDFGLTFWHGLQWPWPHWSPLAVVLWAPWAWLAIALLRSRRGSLDADGVLLLGLGGWVLLQLLATAYARGAGGPEPAPRYMDTLVFGAIVNALALGWLATRTGAQPRILGTLAAAWLAAFTWGTAHYTRLGWRELHLARDGYRAAETNVRAYMLTNDARYLENKDIPYPSSEAFIGFMGHSALRALLPAIVRPPMEMTPVSTTGFRLVKPGHVTTALPHTMPPLPGEPYWSSWNDGKSSRTGEWISVPLDSTSRELVFRIAGAGPDAALEIRDAATLETLTRLEPPTGHEGSWQTVRVRTPSGSFLIAAIDHSDSGWLAFTAPVEVPSLSVSAVWLAHHGWLLARYAAGIALVFTLLTIAFPSPIH
jgi:hypothetical protein